MAKRVSVINFKGGVGKTTLSFNFAAGLAKFHGARVLVVDVDHQSSLSIVCLNAESWNNLVNKNSTICEIFKPFIGQSTAFPGREIIESHAIKNAGGLRYNNMDIVPASLQLDDIEIDLTATHHGNAIHSEWNKRTLICRWLDETKIDKDYDYIIFDCPPATKIVSQNAIAASHGYIITVVPESVMERGAPHLVSMINNGIDKKLQALASMGDKRQSFVRNTKLVGLVITRIKTHGPAASGYTDDHTIHLGSLQRRWGALLVDDMIEDGTGVSQSLSDGVPVYDRHFTQNVGGRGIDAMFQNVTATLKERIDKL